MYFFCISGKGGVFYFYGIFTLYRDSTPALAENVALFPSSFSRSVTHSPSPLSISQYQTTLEASALSQGETDQPLSLSPRHSAVDSPRPSLEPSLSVPEFPSFSGGDENTGVQAPRVSSNKPSGHKQNLNFHRSKIDYVGLNTDLSMSVATTVDYAPGGRLFAEQQRFVQNEPVTTKTPFNCKVVRHTVIEPAISPLMGRDQQRIVHDPYTTESLTFQKPPRDYLGLDAGAMNDDFPSSVLPPPVAQTRDQPGDTVIAGKMSQAANVSQGQQPPSTQPPHRDNQQMKFQRSKVDYSALETETKDISMSTMTATDYYTPADMEEITKVTSPLAGANEPPRQASRGDRPPHSTVLNQLLQSALEGAYKGLTLPSLDVTLSSVAATELDSEEQKPLQVQERQQRHSEDSLHLCYTSSTDHVDSSPLPHPLHTSKQSQSTGLPGSQQPGVIPSYASKRSQFDDLAVSSITGEGEGSELMLHEPGSTTHQGASRAQQDKGGKTIFGEGSDDRATQGNLLKADSRPPALSHSSPPIRKPVVTRESPPLPEGHRRTSPQAISPRDYKFHPLTEVSFQATSPPSANYTPLKPMTSSPTQQSLSSVHSLLHLSDPLNEPHDSQPSTKPQHSEAVTSSLPPTDLPSVVYTPHRPIQTNLPSFPSPPATRTSPKAMTESPLQTKSPWEASLQTSPSTPQKVQTNIPQGINFLHTTHSVGAPPPESQDKFFTPPLMDDLTIQSSELQRHHQHRMESPVPYGQMSYPWSQQMQASYPGTPQLQASFPRAQQFQPLYQGSPQLQTSYPGSIQLQASYPGAQQLQPPQLQTSYPGSQQLQTLYARSQQLQASYPGSQQLQTSYPGSQQLQRSPLLQAGSPQQQRRSTSPYSPRPVRDINAHHHSPPRYSAPAQWSTSPRLRSPLRESSNVAKSPLFLDTQGAQRSRSPHLSTPPTSPNLDRYSSDQASLCSSDMVPAHRAHTQHHGKPAAALASLSQVCCIHACKPCSSEYLGSKQPEY